MMQTTQNRPGLHTLVLCNEMSVCLQSSWQRHGRLRDARPQRHMGTPVVVVSRPCPYDAVEMTFAQWNHKVETLSS